VLFWRPHPTRQHRHGRLNRCCEKISDWVSQKSSYQSKIKEEEAKSTMNSEEGEITDADNNTDAKSSTALLSEIR